MNFSNEIYKPSTIRDLCFSFSVLALSLTGEAAAQAAEPGITGNIFNLPVVVVDSKIYNIDFEIADVDGELRLNLASTEELTGVDTTGAAIYYCIPFTFNCFLNVPHLSYGGNSMWGEFQVLSVDPVVFNLHAADVNQPGESGFEGKWRYLTVNVSEDCGEKSLPRFDILTIKTNGAQFLINDTIEATRVDSTLEWSGTVPDGTGTVTYTTMVTLDTPTLLGTTNWTYSDSSVSCSGVNEHEGALLHN